MSERPPLLWEVAFHTRIDGVRTGTTVIIPAPVYTPAVKRAARALAISAAQESHPGSDVVVLLIGASARVQTALPLTRLTAGSGLPIPCAIRPRPGDPA